MPKNSDIPGASLESVLMQRGRELVAMADVTQDESVKAHLSATASLYFDMAEHERFIGDHGYSAVRPLPRRI